MDTASGNTTADRAPAKTGHQKIVSSDYARAWASWFGTMQLELDKGRFVTIVTELRTTVIETERASFHVEEGQLSVGFNFVRIVSERVYEGPPRPIHGGTHNARGNAMLPNQDDVVRRLRIRRKLQRRLNKLKRSSVHVQR